MSNFQQATSDTKNYKLTKNYGCKSLGHSGKFSKIEIGKAKLRLICSRYNIWDHYDITRNHYVRLSEAEKLQMLKGFFKNKLLVYFGEAKFFVCCKNCVFVDGGRKQDFLIASLTLYTVPVLLTRKKFFLLTKSLY